MSRALLQLLAPNAAMYGDGGGKALSIVNPLHGPDRIVRFLMGLHKKFPGQYSAQPVDVNGTPALLLLRNGELQAVASYWVAEGRVTRIFHVLNPDKLAIPPLSQYIPDHKSLPPAL